MPTYEYACRQCDQHLEVVQSFKDEALTTCGACGGPLRKVFSAAGIIFKGSGYYVNDTRQKQSKTAGDGKAGKDGGKSDSGDASSSPAESGSAKSGSAKSGSPESGGSKSEGSKSDSAKSSGQRGNAESA